MDVHDHVPELLGELVRRESAAAALLGKSISAKDAAEAVGSALSRSELDGVLRWVCDSAPDLGSNDTLLRSVIAGAFDGDWATCVGRLRSLGVCSPTVLDRFLAGLGVPPQVRPRVIGSVGRVPPRRARGVLTS